MPELTHMAMCTMNNRRLARFYQFIFGMEEVWNEEQNSPYAYYIGDGYFQLNCLLLHSGSGRAKIVDGREILPDVEINHVGFQVDNLDEIGKRLAEISPPIKPNQSRPDGRHEDQRFDDPEGNPLELSLRGWPAGTGKELPKIRHVGIKAEDPDRLADFYKFVFSLKEVGRIGGDAIYLSDGTVNIALVKKSPIPKSGIQLLGFQVPSVEEIEDRIKQTMRAYTYKGEQPIEVRRRPTEGPYKAVWLQDPDGNHIDLSEEGWQV
ncbi:MAG: VOC family protein [Candidatus Binatia bacterium]